MFEAIACPQCDAAAAVLDRFSLDGTDGPVEHVRTHCVDGHYFTARVSTLTTARKSAGAAPRTLH